MSNSTRRKHSQDIDQEAVFSKFEDSFSDPDSRNFVLEFDTTKAVGALDLNADELEQALNFEQRAGSSSTRWVNIWIPEKQKDVLTIIATKYGFSPRLLSLMCSDPLKPSPAVISPPPSRNGMLHRYKNIHKISLDRGDDPENQMEMEDRPAFSAGLLDLNHYRIIDEVWHFCSVDWGHRYLCIGYNSLHNVHVSPPADDSSAAKSKNNRPAGQRIWTWLILCDDGTVISIHENPFPTLPHDLSSKQQKNLDTIRRNILNVFRQLSKANPTTTLAIRFPLGSTKDTNSQAQSVALADAPSLLFYYIFDDWSAVYGLVARREHQYGAQLEHLRENMFGTADLEHVNRLHQIGRQLAVLKRIYQSYDLIIERILDRQKPIENPTAPTAATLQGLRNRLHDSGDDLTQSNSAVKEFMAIGVPLASVAIVRFERLKDRIRLYALSEIQECLDEKEQLVFLNFNLIAIKESRAVDRLTRITILLAKFTILFLPVSLMTAYFSTQVEGVDGYTVKQFWTAFAVIFGISFLFLIVFGKLSGTLESKSIYRSLTETFYDASKAAFKARKNKRKGG